MEIFVNNKSLDVYDQEVSMHFSSMRFSDPIQDEYSTDIELPKTKSNVTALDAWGMLDRGQMFGRKVPCKVIFDGPQLNGYMQITKVEAEKITATLFLSNVPDGMWDSNIVAGVEDDGNTIFPYRGDDVNSYLPTAESLNWYPNGGSLWNPNILVNRILQNISVAYNMTLPQVDSSLCVLSSKRYICPQNKDQFIQWVNEGTGEYYMKTTRGGSHVCCPYNNDGGIQTLTITRDCKCRIHCAVQKYGTLTRLEHAAVVISGTNYSITIRDVYSEGIVYSITISDLTLHEGDTIELMAYYEYSYGMMWIEYSDYEVYQEDYAVDMNVCTDFCGFPEGETFPKKSAESVFNYPNAAWQYLGAYSSLPECSVREFMSSLAWYLGKTIHFENNVVTFVDSNVTKKISARINTMEPIYEGLGKITIANWKAGREGVYIYFDNDFLESEKNIHTSVFYGAGYDGNVPQFVDGKWEDVDGLPLMKRFTSAQSGLTYLRQPDQMSTMGIEDLSRIMLIDGETYDYISNCDYVIIDGHKYMVVDGDRDVDTGLTTFRALLV